MTIVEMLGQSGSLSVLGMGVVVGFLVIMVFCVSVMGRIAHVFMANRYPKDNIEEKKYVQS